MLKDKLHFVMCCACLDTGSLKSKWDLRGNRLVLCGEMNKNGSCGCVSPQLADFQLNADVRNAKISTKTVLTCCV